MQVSRKFQEKSEEIDKDEVSSDDNRDNDSANFFNPSFKPTKYIFDNIMDNKNVVTSSPIVSIKMMNSSKSVITITKPSLLLSRIRVFDISSGRNLFNDEINGSFVKVSEIVTNPYSPDICACPYNDNGRFNIRLYDFNTFSKKTIDINE